MFFVLALGMEYTTGTEVLVDWTLHRYLVEEIFDRSGDLTKESSLEWLRCVVYNAILQIVPFPLHLSD